MGRAQAQRAGSEEHLDGPGLRVCSNVTWRCECCSQLLGSEEPTVAFQGFGELMEVFLVLSNGPWWECLHHETGTAATLLLNTYQRITP